MSDPIHHLTIRFDGGIPYIQLNCPETGGCQPPGYCSECGRERGDKDKEPCDCCVADNADFCNAKAWCDAQGSVDWVDGEVTVPVEIDWSSDEGPTLGIVPSDEARIRAEERDRICKLLRHTYRPGVTDEHPAFIIEQHARRQPGET